MQSDYAMIRVTLCGIENLKCLKFRLKRKKDYLKILKGHA